MKIKRYIAGTMREALAEVRAEQGPDAVILSSRRVDDGIEVIAAVDYDEALIAGATQKRIPTEPVAPQPATRAAPVPDQTSSDGGFTALQAEVRGLRHLLQGNLAQVTSNDKRLREPLQARVLEQLTAMDIAPDMAMSMATRAPRRTNLKNPSHLPLALLARYLKVVDDLSPLEGGVVALVGPTGAGKTTTIAKLAARWAMQHGSRNLALVSTDGYRIGAREQLMTYGRILGAPTHAANTGQELARVLERLKSKKLVLIDTAGMGPRDIRLSEQLAALQLGAAGARVLLTLPAQAEAHALEEIVQSFASVTPQACILTKVDEAASLGGVISTVLRHGLRVAYLCNGQRVPEDLHAAHVGRVWLIRTALRLKQRIPAPTGGAHAARSHRRAPAHA